MSTVTEVSILLSLSPTPFIFVNDLNSPRLTTNTLINDLNAQETHVARVDGIVCFTPRLFFDAVINSLTSWKPSWEDGCANWSPSEVQTTKRYNDSFDAFLHGLKDVNTHLSKESQRPAKMALIVENPERLKEAMPEVLVPLTRLRELVSIT
jgi:origin recognition complex subunit 5